MTKQKKMDPTDSTTLESPMEIVENNICITCSTLGECEDVLILTFEDTEFIKILHSCMDFKLSGQELKYMCLECINTIISFYTFKIAAAKSYEELCKKQAKINTHAQIDELKPEATPDNSLETSEHIVFVSIEDVNLVDIDDNETDHENSIESMVPNINKPVQPDSTDLKADVVKSEPYVKKLEVDVTELDVNSDDVEVIMEPEHIICLDENGDKLRDESEKVPLETAKEDITNWLSIKELKERNQWQCSYCGMLISKNNPAGIKKHRYTEKSKRLRIYECPECHKMFTKQVIKEHILRHGDEKPAVCKICQKRVSSDQALKNHMMLHNGKKFRCDVCKKGFTQQFLLKEHMSTHDRDTSFLCPTCGMSFPNPTRLRQHMYKHKALMRRQNSNEGDKSCHICDFCGKTFSSAKTLIVHRTKHASDEKFECGRCGKEFGHRALLTSHVWLHIAEFRCQKCFIIFQNDDLRKHDCKPLPEDHVFDDFLPNECRKCGEILQHGMMNRHMRRHEARECKICGEKFFTARKFQFHMNSHRLKCQLCDKGFAKKNSYILHINNKVCERINSNYIKRLAS